MQFFFYSGRLKSLPLIYSTQPNLGLYFRQDGPYPNPSELLPSGKINEAMVAQEEAAEHLKNDLI